MSRQVCIGIRFVRELLLIVLCIALLYIMVEARAHAYRHAEAIDEMHGVSLPEDGITLDRGSHISVRRTPKAVFVQVLHGDVLLKARDLTLPPVVVRAGNAQIRNLDATVCVDMDGDRASVEIIDGAARVGSVDGDSRLVNEITLRAGDRAEIQGNSAVVTFRLARSGGTRTECRHLMGA